MVVTLLTDEYHGTIFVGVFHPPRPPEHRRRKRMISFKKKFCEPLQKLYPTLEG